VSVSLAASAHEGAQAVRGDTALRRGVDLVLGGLGLAAASPVLLLIAAAVKLESRGPAFFSQERVGKDGRPFRIHKFRSMVAGADRMGPAVSGNRDPRVTRVGGVLRATKLDELPQLVNVVKGEMTLIGPRAEVARYVAHYTGEERALLTVRPGLTGPGQVHFTMDQAGELDGVDDPDRHYIEQQLHPKLALDLEYLRRRSLALDLSILGGTIALLLGRRGRRKSGADRGTAGAARG
jgi:lipopolysaccharide/colanic/teichoic acid biosynthesis glycosyltransferase